MKTQVKRVVALTLGLILMLALPAYATGSSSNYGVYDLVVENGYTLTPQTADGTVDTAVTEDVDGDGTEESVYKNTEKFTLYFSGNSDAQYVVFLLNGEAGDESPVPTETNIRYIDQKGGSTTVEFILYPDTLEKAGTYAVYISNSGTDGSYTRVASFDVMSFYTLGDVNDDGSINSADALLVLQCSVGNKTLNDSQRSAADVNGDSSINSADALKILQYSVGNITDFS